MLSLAAGAKYVLLPLRALLCPIIIHIFCSFDGALEVVKIITICYFTLFFLPPHIHTEVKIKLSPHPNSIGYRIIF